MKLWKYCLSVLFCLNLSCVNADTAQKDWTVYIHLNANNNLCQFAPINIKALEAYKGLNANFLVTYACYTNKISKYMLIEGDKETVLEQDVKYDMGDWKLLVSQAERAFKAYPAKNYMIDVWDHGAGWKDAMPTVKGISYDDQSGNHITTLQLGQAMQTINTDGYHISILGMDACLMQMAEIAYEMGSKNVDYILGSEETEPGQGWDYSAMSKTLASPDVSPAVLGKNMVDAYMTYNPDASSTQSFVSVPAVETFAKDFGKFWSTASATTKKSVYTTMGTAVSFYDYDYKDFGSFLAKMPATPELDQVKIDYSKSVLSNGISPKKATGFSIYYSKYPMADYYNLKFAKDTGWLK